MRRDRNGRPLCVLLATTIVLLTPLFGMAHGQGRRGGPPPSFQGPSARPWQGRLSSSSACANSASQSCLTPTRLRAAYAIDPLLHRGITGKGRTIAIVVSYGSLTLRADLHAFDRAFGLTDPQLDMLAPLGPVHAADPGWAGETTLDVEWAHVVAPAAHLIVLESPVNETEGVRGLPEFLAVERYALQHGLVDVISQSWGATENTLFTATGRRLVAQFHRFYADAAARGVTVVCASGDDGAAGSTLSLSRLFPYPVVQFPADDPLVLAVGGTRLDVDPHGRARDETAWIGSGGGVSKIYQEPSYQEPLPAAMQRLLAGRRGLPDVAYNAAPQSPFPVYQKGRWTLASGTSAAAPQWAALIALADQAAGHDLGSINADLYQLAISPRYHMDLRDIGSGGIAGPKRDGSGTTGIAFRAGRGWDAATGWGSPRAAALLFDLIKMSRQDGGSHRCRSCNSASAQSG